MRNIILFFCFAILFKSAKAQESYYDIVKPRIACLSQNETKIKSREYIVLNTDTLFSSKVQAPNLDALLKTTERRKLLFKYRTQVFRYASPEESLDIYQWNSDIVIYFDKDIPKTIQTKFINFFTQLNVIENINISFTSKLNKANYYIKTSSEIINAYGDKYVFESEEEKDNSIYYGGIYKLITDGNNKFYGGVIKINLESKSSEEKQLKQLKQLFFTSLGQFYVSPYKDTTSLFSESYDNNDIISNFDLEFLKLHYTTIYEQKINSTIFKRLQNLQKENNE